jgi:hypothetical protein
MGQEIPEIAPQAFVGSQSVEGIPALVTALDV